MSTCAWGAGRFAARRTVTSRSRVRFRRGVELSENRRLYDRGRCLPARRQFKLDADPFRLFDVLLVERFAGPSSRCGRSATTRGGIGVGMRQRRLDVFVFQRPQLVDRRVQFRQRRWRHELAADIDDLTQSKDAQQRGWNFKRGEFVDAARQQRKTDDETEDAALIAIDVELAVAG